jgi:hypothetical protein
VETGKEEGERKRFHGLPAAGIRVWERGVGCGWGKWGKLDFGKFL